MDDYDIPGFYSRVASHDGPHDFMDIYVEGNLAPVLRVCRKCGYREPADADPEIARLKARLGITRKDGAL